MAAITTRQLASALRRVPLRTAVPARNSSSVPGKLIRSATTGLRATIFGAYGFVGRYVTALLAGSGTQCVIPFRGDDMEWRHLKVGGDLGIVQPVPYSPRDLDSVRRAIDGSDIVINLIGKDYETKHFMPWLKNYTFEDVHITTAETIAKIAYEMNASSFIHMSALSADENSLSAFSRTKALGEQAVRAIIPGATIVRPADVFGPEDRFLNMFARMYELTHRITIVDGGSARVQPVYVNDLATAIFKLALSEDPEVMLGQTYDFAGPSEYTYREIVEFVFESIRASRPEILNLPPVAAELIGQAIDILPNPLVTKDRFVRMQTDNVLSDLSDTKRFHDLGIEAASMESPSFTFMHRYRQGTQFDELAAKHARSH